MMGFMINVARVTVISVTDDAVVPRTSDVRLLAIIEVGALLAMNARVSILSLLLDQVAHGMLKQLYSFVINFVSGVPWVISISWLFMR